MISVCVQQKLPEDCLKARFNSWSFHLLDNSRHWPTERINTYIKSFRCLSHFKRQMFHTGSVWRPEDRTSNNTSHLAWLIRLFFFSPVHDVIRPFMRIPVLLATMVKVVYAAGARKQKVSAWDWFTVRLMNINKNNSWNQIYFNPLEPYSTT